MTDTFYAVDMSSLKDFAKVLKKVEPSLLKELEAGLVAGGEIIATAARSKASFSSRIPASIVTKRRAFRVKIQAGGDAAPDAAPFENGGQQGTFRHPVYGNRDVWVSQKAHPFLTPAAVSASEPAFDVVLAAVDRALIGISVF